MAKTTKTKKDDTYTLSNAAKTIVIDATASAGSAALDDAIIKVLEKAMTIMSNPVIPEEGRIKIGAALMDTLFYRLANYIVTCQTLGAQTKSDDEIAATLKDYLAKARADINEAVAKDGLTEVVEKYSVLFSEGSMQ